VAGLQAEPRLALTFAPQVTAAVTCHQCEGAPCLAVCPVDAIVRTDEAVVVNEQACIGCKLCAIVCPFGAIHPAGTSTAGVAGIAFETPSQPRGTSPLLAWSIGVYTCAVKCDLCSTYDPEGGPHCVRACPTNALFVRDATTLGDARKDKMKAAVTANQIMMGRSTNLKEA
jgi:hydrogenase-4 component A